MARVIRTLRNTNVGFKVVNVYTDDTTSESIFFENDRVEKLQFVAGSEVSTITGRVDAVAVSNIPGVNTNVGVCAKAENLISVTGFTIDHSAKENAKKTFVSAVEVLEYNATEGKEIKKVEVKPVVTVDVTVSLSDGTSSSLKIAEGDVLSNVVLFGKNGESEVTIKVDQFIYSRSASGKVVVTGVAQLDENGKIEKAVQIDTIKDCGKKLVVVGSEVSIADALAGLTESDGGLVLPAQTYAEPVTFGKEVLITGAKAGISAATGERKSDVIADDETVLADVGTYTVGADVVIDGVTLTEKARMVVENASSVEFKNCKFVETSAYQPKSYLLVGTGFTENSTVVKFDNCYFGTNTANATGGMYNLFEGNFKLADGSSIKNCYFAKGCCSHNQINIYDVEDDAVITIEGNHFEKSANAIRLGTINDAKCTINIDDNSYDETDTDPAWAGILLVQPYGKKTTNMSNITVNINRTKAVCGGQLWYLYMGGGDTQLTDDQKPNVFIDGVRA